MGFQIFIFDLPLKLTLDAGEATKTIPISRPKYNYLVGHPQYPNWYEPALASNTNALIGNLSFRQYSQTAVIVGQLVGSAAASHLLLEADDKRVETAIELISDLRVATRERKIDPLIDDSYSNLWDHSLLNFQQAISSLEEVERKKLADQYDRLWGNFNITSAIQFGENENGALASGFEPNADELDSVARRLVTLTPMRSDELERILISSLIYAETIAFARKILSKEKLMGMTIPTVIIKKSAEYDGVKSIAIAVWATTKNIAVDCIKIALTFALAFIVSNENHIAAWIVATGYTLFRWWREMALIMGKKDLSEIELLLKMAVFHKLVDDQSSNPRLLREQLYKITDKGAVFSPWVFTLIDRQINSVDDRSQSNAR